MDTNTGRDDVVPIQKISDSITGKGHRKVMQTVCFSETAALPMSLRGAKLQNKTTTTATTAAAATSSSPS
jgi:hypothetical protein